MQKMLEVSKGAVGKPSRPWSAEWKRQFRRKLVAWYRRHRRDLPWRESSDPYGIWISEVMLQQTQVATVVPYFRRFLAAFPNVKSLARAPEHDVLKLWAGLGYYRRARQLHLAAKAIVREHKGRLPREPDVLAELPGVGRYTAGAIASIAFGVRAPILEANTRRLLARLSARPGKQVANESQLWKLAEDLLPRTAVGDFNQALMELGSQICKPVDPACDRCPVTALCSARTSRVDLRSLSSSRRPTVEQVREVALIVRNGDRVLIRQCQHGERWAGLWDFLRFPHDDPAADGAEKLLRRRCMTATGLKVSHLSPLATLKHSVTRFRITLDCYTGRLHTGAPAVREGFAWVEREMLDDWPLTRPAQRIADLVRALGKR